VRRLALLGLALSMVGLAASGAGHSSPRLGRLTAIASIRDGTLRPGRALEMLKRSSWGGPVTAADGETVTVFVSDAYPVDPSLQQTAADFLTQLYHGSELSSVTVYLAPLSEVESVCRGDAVGCYGGGRIVATGDTLPDGTSPANVLAHEYGHHVAVNRDNSPWPAGTWGPKRWATAAQVCRRQASGTAFPGDEGEHYRLNPGEAWAETFRLLNYEKQAWPAWVLQPWNVVDQSFFPDTAELDAARADVLQPWRRGRAVSWTGRLRRVGKGGKSRMQRARRVVSTPLDGDLALIVPHAPPGMTLTVSTLGGRVLGGTNVRILPIRVCGQRRLVLTVRSRTPGRFEVSYSAP
jgi:hypothetical protein